MTEKAPANDPKPADDPKPTTPPWGDDFDASRAWDTITRQRDSETALKKRIADFEKAEQERADADASELDKAVKRAERAEAAVAEAKRDAVIAKSGLPEELHAFVTATDDEGIAAQIAKLSAFAKKDDDNGDEGDNTDTGRPKAALKPGHGGDDPAPFDPDAIVAAARA